MASSTKTNSVSRRFNNSPIITEADVRRAIVAAHGTLTDKQIFTSSAYHRKMNAFARFITGRTGRNGSDISVASRVEWNEKDSSMTAYTDGVVAVINAACEPIHKAYKQRIDRHYAIMGLAVHEFAHCLFTDFSLMKAQHNAFMDGKMYPAEPPSTPENEAGITGMKTLLEKGSGARMALFKLYKNLDNIIEDSYIEKSLVLLFPGDAKRAIRFLNKALFGDDFMELVQEMYTGDKYVSKWALFANAMLILLEMKTINLDTSFNDDVADIAERLYKLLPRLQRETENSSHIARKQLCLDIILENWDLIEEDMKNGMSMEETINLVLDLSGMTTEEAAAILEGIFGQMNENTGADHERENDPNGGTPIRVFIELPPDVELPDMDGSGSGGGDADVEIVISGGKQKESQGEDGQGDSGASSGSGSDDGNNESGNTKGDNSDSSEGGGGPLNGGAEPTTIPSNGPAAAGNTGETVTITFGNDEGEDTDGGGNTLTRDLSEVEDGLSREAADKSVESKLQEILQDNANASKATTDHWNIQINRTKVTADGARRYEAIWPKLRNVSKALKKELLKILSERRTGARQTGLIFGRRIDTRSLSRQDEKFFVKNKSPDDHPQVAVVLLIDASGSMASGAVDSSGQGLFDSKIQAASNTALVLYDFCVELDFPVMVCSHTTGDGNTVIINSMAAFQRVNKHETDDRYRIAGAEASWGNRDGTALNYALSELKMRTEEIKLLFIISDGLPADYGPEENGVQHLQEVMEDARRSGVFVFAAALNEDIPAIKHIYGESMFEMTDLAKMPKTLLNVMSRFLK